MATSSDEKPKYVVSSTGHSAHPDDIISSCKALQDYIKKVQDDADRELKDWEEKIAARELAEKRRVAPGWLDSDARILEPERVGSRTAAKTAASSSQPNIMDIDALKHESSGLDNPSTPETSNEAGDELDRAFGGLGVR
jgi:hypothetical protein